MFQSTHSLRSATYAARKAFSIADVSIHALLAECDGQGHGLCRRRAGFNPRTPCGVRLAEDDGRSIEELVSIHALLAECDPVPYRPFSTMIRLFQSTHSLRSATIYPTGELVTSMVSIHALLAECDSSRPKFGTHAPRFNPRTPCGVRLTRIIRPPPRGRFQSTHSLRSATPRTGREAGTVWFQSTHSLRSATVI